MRQRVMLLALLCAGIGLVSGTSAARADFTVTQTKSIDPTPTNFGAFTPAGQNPIVFEQFDHTKYDTNGQTAVLTQVTLKVDYTFETTATVRFDNVSTIMVTTSQMQITVNDSTNSPLIVGKVADVVQSKTYTPPSDVFGKYYNLGTVTRTGSATFDSLTDPSRLNQFVGTGVLGLPANATAFTDTRVSSGNGFGGAATVASAQINLVYHYILVPEPSSCVIMGLGVTGLMVGAVRRARFGFKKPAVA